MLFGLYSLKTVATVPQDDQVDFVALPRISPIASGLAIGMDDLKK